MRFLSPLALSRVNNPHYQVTPHLRLLERFVLKLLAQKGRAKGIIELPIRHGKSEFVSKILPAWFLLSHPDKRVILSGYGGEFASEWGRQARDIFGRHGKPLFGLSLNPKLSKADHWGVAGHLGSMRTCGTLGSISGKTADLLISDDQIKDQAQANSPTQRDRVHSWFMSDALSRLEPDGKAIVVLSRRHPDDLVGRLLAADDSWQTLRLPALCDAPSTDPLGRAEGEALWPERFSSDALLKIREELELSGQGHIWECLYQQSPTGDPAAREWPADYFSKIWTPTIPADNVRLKVLSLDPSKGKRSTTGDYSAFTSVTLTRDGHLYVKSWLHRIPTDQLIQQAVSLLNSERPNGFIYESTLFQELLGTMISQECVKQGVPCPIWEYAPQEDKIVRIRMALTPLLGQRRLHLDETSQGNRLLLNQLQSFPTGAHDDGPDSLTMAVYLLDEILNGKQPKKLLLSA